MSFHRPVYAFGFLLLCSPAFSASHSGNMGKRLQLEPPPLPLEVHKSKATPGDQRQEKSVLENGPIPMPEQGPRNPPRQCKTADFPPPVPNAARTFSKGLRPNERRLAQLMKLFFNLYEDDQLSVDSIESQVTRLVASNDLMGDLAKLYEQVARKEAIECNEQYLHLLTERVFNPLKDELFSNDLSAPERLGVTPQEFSLFEDALARATARRDIEATKNNP